MSRQTTRTPPPPDAVGRAYDAAAETFDERFQRNKVTIKRFAVIDEPQRKIARECGRVLELGSGTGRLLERVSGPEIIGIDVAMALLRQSAPRGYRAVHGDAHALPFRDQSFDAVLGGNGVFRYLAYDQAVGEAARVLRPGGFLLVHQYAAASRRLIGRRKLSGEGLHLQSAEEIITIASQAGLRFERGHYWRTIGFYPWILRLPASIAGQWWSHVVLTFRKGPA